MIVRRHRRQLLHPAQFTVGFLPHVVGQIGFGKPLAELCGLGLFAAFIVAQLFLDRFHLLAQHVIALGLIHFGLGFVGNLRTQANDLNFVREKIVSQVHQLVYRVGDNLQVIPADGPDGVWYLANPVDGLYHPNAAAK